MKCVCACVYAYVCVCVYAAQTLICFKCFSKLEKEKVTRVVVAV